MPLDNTAKMSDIISALQTMEGINAKADLASVIGSPAQDTDTMATLVSLIQQSKNELATKMGDGSTGAEPLRALVGNLVVGKKWADGKITSQSTTKSFPGQHPGGIVGSSFVVFNMSILAFVPKYILLFQTDLKSASPTTWRKDPFYEGTFSLVNTRSGSNMILCEYKIDTIDLPVDSSNKEYHWVAFE